MKFNIVFSIKRIVSLVVYIAILIGIDYWLGFNIAILSGIAMMLVELSYPNK